MPLTLDQLGPLITRAPAELYQGGAGSGMRQIAEMRSRERMHANELGLQRQKSELMEKARRQEMEQSLFKQWGAAVMSGDRDAIELTAQQLEASGFQVKRPVEGSMTDGVVESDPTAGVPRKEQPIVTDQRSAGLGIDEFFRTGGVGRGKAPVRAPKLAKPALTGEVSNNPIEDAANEVSASPEQQAAFEQQLISGGTGGSLDPLGSTGKPRKIPDWVVARPDGSVVATFDEQEIKTQRRARVAETFAPLIEQAPDETARQAAIKAARTAITMSDSDGLSKAVESGMKVYQFEVGPRRGRYVGGGGGGGGGTSLSKQRFEASQDINAARYARQIINNEQMNGGIRNLNQLRDSAQKSVALSSSKNPLAQLGAMTGTLKAFFSSVTSDKELAAFQGAGGKVNQLETEYNKWMAGGKLPDDFMRRLKDVAQLTDKYAETTMRERGKHARKNIEDDPYLRGSLTPEELKNWGDLSESIWLGGGERAGGAKPKQSNGGGDATDDDVVDLF